MRDLPVRGSAGGEGQGVSKVLKEPQDVLRGAGLRCAVRTVRGSGRVDVAAFVSHMFRPIYFWRRD